MTAEELELHARATAREFSFIISAETLLRTPATLTMRFRITERCFIQLYANTNKALFSYTLVLAGTRIFGRDCDGGEWHRHPFEAPESHDSTPEGRQEISLGRFFEEVQDILHRLQIV